MIKSGRSLKKAVGDFLRQDDFDSRVRDILNFPLMPAVNALFSFLYSTDDQLKFRSVRAMGIATAALADDNTESARTVMRRLMWSLNDESGGIGWGAPEAMGEIMAQSRKLAEEYHRILLSYIREDQNYLENDVLRNGALWGVRRLAEAHPDLSEDLNGYTNISGKKEKLIG